MPVTMTAVHLGQGIERGPLGGSVRREEIILEDSSEEDEEEDQPQDGDGIHVKPWNFKATYRNPDLSLATSKRSALLEQAMMGGTARSPSMSPTLTVDEAPLAILTSDWRRTGTSVDGISSVKPHLSRFQTQQTPGATSPSSFTDRMIRVSEEASPSKRIKMEQLEPAVIHMTRFLEKQRVDYELEHLGFAAIEPPLELVETRPKRPAS